jgi:hypothetical protein
MRLRAPRAERFLGWTLALAAIVWITTTIAAFLVLSGSPQQVMANYAATLGVDVPTRLPTRIIVGAALGLVGVAAQVVTLGGLAALLALRARTSAMVFRARESGPHETPNAPLSR